MAYQNLYKLKASAKKLSIELKKRYTVDTTALKNAHTSSCNAFCILVAEHAYSEPKCLDHPKLKKPRHIDHTTKMQSTSGLRGGCLEEKEEDHVHSAEHDVTTSSDADEVEQLGTDTEESLTHSTGPASSDESEPTTPCESIFSITSTSSNESYVGTIKDFKLE